MLAVVRAQIRTWQPDAGALRRGLLAGGAWGLLLATAFIALAAWQCGGVCVEESATTAAIALVAGILTMGPLAAFGRRSRG
jgi:hypothetical protein